MERKVLLINQHSSNHGDEAAAKALTHKIDFSNCEVSILYNTVSKNAILKLGIDFAEILLTETMSRVSKLLLLVSFFLPLRVSSLFFTRVLRNEFKMIKNSDVVISMPGGANLGLYNDWRYLWRLFTAVKLGKKTAVYSISFGPFSNYIFKKLTKYVLSRVDFLSLRDAQSFRYADEMELEYVKSIDTALLTSPIVSSFDLEEVGVPFERKDYVVFVANDLTSGHVSFSGYSSEKLQDIYVSILESLLERNLNVVFLPQLFANGNDAKFFKKIISKTNQVDTQKIVIVDENYSSDVQQNIVNRASMVVGARYHSIIFSLNSEIPFLCLSYENKMKNTLELLGYEKYSLDLTLLPRGKSAGEFKQEANLKISNIASGGVSLSNREAKEIVQHSFDKLEAEFLKPYIGV